MPLPNSGSVPGDGWKNQAVMRAASTVVGTVAPGMAIAIVNPDPEPDDRTRAITTTYEGVTTPTR